jgi:ankyrin repeat protein
MNKVISIRLMSIVALGSLAPVYCMETDQEELKTNALRNAIASYNFAEVKELVEKGVDPNTASEWGCTSLIQATLRNHLPTVEFLLKRGANVNFKNSVGKNPLFYISQGKENIGRKLLLHGAHVTSKCHPSIDRVSDLGPFRHTPLSHAVNHFKPELVKLLLKYGANPNQHWWINTWFDTVKQPITLVQAARSFFHSVPISLLLDKAVASPRYQLVRSVVANIREDTERVLLEGSITNIDKPYDHGTTLLMIAALHGRLRTVRLLLNHAANCTLANNDGDTAWSLALQNKHLKTAKVLENYAQAQTKEIVTRSILSSEESIPHLPNEVLRHIGIYTLYPPFLIPT